MREWRVTLDEHLDDRLQEGLDLVGTQRVLCRYFLVLAKTFQDILSSVDTAEEDADVVHGVDELAQLLY